MYKTYHVFIDFRVFYPLIYERMLNLKAFAKDILYIQERTDLLCAKLGTLTRNGANIDNAAINELISIGVDISMVCQMLLDTTE